MESKKCKDCSIEKPINEFYKRSCRCIPCHKLKNKQWSNNNKEKIKQYYLDNKNNLKQYSNNRYYNNKEYHSEWMKKYYQENKEQIILKSKQYKINNPKYSKEYYLNNKEKIFKNIKEWEYNNPHIRRWRNLLNNTINFNKTDSTESLLGYNYQQLKEYLESQGMDWDKHQIDHKIPVSWFEENTPPHVVNDLRNLQPLLPEVNKNKSNTFGDLVPFSYIYDIEQYIKKQYKNKLWQLEDKLLI